MPSYTISPTESARPLLVPPTFQLSLITSISACTWQGIQTFVNQQTFRGGVFSTSRTSSLASNNHWLNAPPGLPEGTHRWVGWPGIQAGGTWASWRSELCYCWTILNDKKLCGLSWLPRPCWPCWPCFTWWSGPYWVLPLPYFLRPPCKEFDNWSTALGAYTDVDVVIICNCQNVLTV